MDKKEIYRCGVKPYEGDESFIFISYSHKDSPQVFPILENMAAQGYRIWYDEGIDPGSEWPETIASHLSKAHACLAFVSENSVNSHNCRREINFALSKAIGFLSVMLDETALSPGLEMQLSAYQSIFRSKLQDDASFYAKLYEAKILEDCKIAGSAPAEKTPEKSDDSGQKSAAPTQPAPAQKKTKRESKRPREKLSRKKLLLAIGIPAAAAVLLAVLLIVFLGKGGRERYAVKDVTAQMLYGDKLCVAEKDSFTRKTGYKDMLIDHKTVNVSSVPFAMDANPANKNLMQLIFLDKFGEEYAVYGNCVVAENALTLSYAESSYYPDASPVTEDLKFDLSVENGEIVLTADDGSRVCLDARDTVENNVYFLDGGAADTQFQELKSLYASVSKSDGETAVTVTFSDGAAVDPEVSEMGPHIVRINWKKAERSYNGRVETFDENGQLQFMFINTHPYGFVLIDEEGAVYNYQAISAISTQETVTVTLYADDDSTSEQLEADLAALKARLDVFAGQGGYRFIAGENKAYTLTLPKESFHGVQVETALKCCITRPIELYAISAADADNVVRAHKSIPSVRISRGEILSAEPQAEAPASYKPEDDKKHSFVKITLAESAITALKDLGTEQFFVQDLLDGYSVWFGSPVIPGEEAGTYYISCQEDEAYARTLAYVLMQEPLSHAFGVEVSMDDLVEWETADSETFGQKQCNVTDFVEQTITYRLSCYDKISAGTLSDDMAEIRTRLDLIDVPYALGQLENEKETILAIKTPVTRIDPAIMTLVGSRYSFKITLRNGCVQEELPNSSYKATSTFKSTDSSSIELQTDGDLLAKLSASASETAPAEIVLVADGYRLLSATVNKPIDGDKITFSSYANSGKPISSTGSDWLAALLSHVLTENTLQNNYSIDSSSDGSGRGYQFVPGRSGATADEADFLCNSSQIDKETIEAVEPLLKDGKVTVSNSTVYVYLCLPFDENLVKTSIETVKKVYQAIDLDTLPYDGITFYLTDEDSDTASERTRIFFDKRYGTSESETYQPGIYVRGIFCNGRAEAYKDAFLKAVTGDAFFTSKVDKNSSSDPWMLES